jgi:hypothetical protein
VPLFRVPIFAALVLLLTGAATFYWLQTPHLRLVKVIRRFWAFYAAGQLLMAGLVFGSHLFFPANLEFMESTVLQHVVRLSTGLPLYVDPTPEFSALAYNPLFYAICVPFVRVMGISLTAIRLPAILAAAGAAVMIFAIVKRQTRSSWWGDIAAGLFAAAYRVMDCYLDVGHRDSLLLLAILSGFWCLDRGGRLKPYLGMLLLASGFWLKQQGALFLGMGVCYVFWQYGWRRGVPLSLVGLGLGPLLYGFAPDAWWGARLHYFTYQVPARWTDFRWTEFQNLVRLLTWHYGALLAVTAGFWIRNWKKHRREIWRIAVPGALLSGAAAMMSPGSNNNVYIPMGAVLIVAGVTGMARLSRISGRGPRLAYTLLALTFASFLYDPGTVVSPADAGWTYAEFTAMLKSLDGPTYAPGLGPIFGPSGGEIHQSPLVHVVSLADMVRGPGRDETANPLVRNLLRTVESPSAAAAYIVAHSKLEEEPTLAYLGASYRLVKSFGNRFQAIATLPARHGHLYPRYLYRSITTAGDGTLARGSK